MNRKDDTVLLSEDHGEQRTGDLSPSDAAASHPSTGIDAPHTVQNTDPHPSPDDTILLNDHGGHGLNDDTGPVDETTLLTAREVSDLNRAPLNTHHHTDPIPDSHPQHHQGQANAQSGQSTYTEVDQHAA
jgi:hypothetical protein